PQRGADVLAQWVVRDVLPRPRRRRGRAYLHGRRVRPRRIPGADAILRQRPVVGAAAEVRAPPAAAYFSLTRQAPAALALCRPVCRETLPAKTIGRTMPGSMSLITVSGLIEGAAAW